MAFALKTHKSAGIRVTWPVHRLIAEGNRARGAGEWGEAAEAYRRALARDGTLAHIWLQLGHMLREIGRIGEAETAYRTASELRPDWSEPFLFLGHQARLRDDRREAVRFYAQAALAEPGRDEGLVELAALLARAQDGTLRATLRQVLDSAPPAAEEAEATVVLDVSDLVDRWLHGDGLDAAARGQIALLAGATAGAGVRLCCLTAERNDWIEIRPTLVRALLAWADKGRLPPATERRRARLELMAADALVFAAGSRMIGLGAPERLANYFLSIRTVQSRSGLSYRACWPDPLPPAAWVAKAADHAAGFLVASEPARDALLAIGGAVRPDRAKLASFGGGWPVEVAAADGEAFRSPVAEARFGRWYGLGDAGETSNEHFRIGLGWHAPDAGGNWTRREGGELAIGLPRTACAPRLYLRLRALPHSDCGYVLKIGHRPRMDGIVRAGEDKWIAVDVPAEEDGLLRIFLRGARQEDVAVDLGGGLRRYPVSLGMVGFCLIERDDEAARWSMLEAIEGRTLAA